MVCFNCAVKREVFAVHLKENRASSGQEPAFFTDIVPFRHALLPNGIYKKPKNGTVGLRSEQ